MDFFFIDYSGKRMAYICPANGDVEPNISSKAQNELPWNAQFID